MNVKSAILFLLLGCAPLAQGASLYVSAPAHVTAGEAFLFDINLAPGSDLLGGLDVSVYFDSSAFTLIMPISALRWAMQTRPCSSGAR